MKRLFISSFVFLVATLSLTTTLIAQCVPGISILSVDPTSTPGQIVVTVQGDTEFGENVVAQARWDNGGFQYSGFISGTYASGSRPNVVFEITINGLPTSSSVNLNIETAACCNDPSCSTLEGYSGFNYPVNGINLLPVTFKTVFVKTNGGFNDVTWQTATETNNAYFNIERSTDSRRWQTLGRVAGAGTTQETQNYTYTDKAPALGTNYYRIQQVDYDGASSYSPIVSAQWKGGVAARLFPNPTATTVRVDLMTGEETPVTLSVYDMLGRLVLQHTPLGTTDLNVGHLPAGAYLLQATHNGNVLLSERLMVE